MLRNVPWQNSETMAIPILDNFFCPTTTHFLKACSLGTLIEQPDYKGLLVMKL